MHNPKLLSKLNYRSAILSLAAVAGITAMFAQSAGAAALTFDTSTAAGIQPGTGGTWDTSGGNSVWTSTGTSLLPWTQTNTFTATNTATLAGADGTYSMNLTGGIAVQTMTVSNSGYTLNATSAQTLSVNNVGSGIFTIATGKTFTLGNNITVAFTGNSNTGTRYNIGNGSIFNINAGASLTKTSGAGLGGFGFRPNVAGDSATINLDGSIIWTSSNAGSGSLTFAESVAGLVTINVNNGAVINTNTGGQQNSKGAITVGDAGTAVMNMASGSTVTISSPINTSYLCIGGTTNAGVGTVNLNGGTLTVPQISKKGTGTASGTLNFNGGQLVANLGTFNTATNAFIGAATGTGGAGTSALDRANVRDGGAKIDTNGFSVWVSQPLLHSNIGGDAATDGGLIKSGAGTLSLSGANTYTGATAVNVGALNVVGSLTSNVTVANNAKFLGTGSTTGSMTFNAGSTLSVDPADEFVANGVDFAGSTTLLFSSALTPSVTYDVIDFGAGGLTSGTTNVIKTVRGSFSTSGTMLQFTAGSVSTDTWNTTSGTWQVGTTTPWTNGSDNEFWNGDTVLFDDTPGADATASISGNVSPAAMTVNNPTYNHNWTGSGSIIGSASLAKSGAGALTIGTANAYTGGTTFNGGTLNINNNSAIGTGTLTVASGSAKVLDSTSSGVVLSTNNAQSWNDDFTFGGTNDLNMGSGVVTLGGSDRTVTLSNNKVLTVGRISSTVGGLILAGNGTLAINQSAASSVTGPINVGSGSTLQINTGALAGTTSDFIATSLTGSGTVSNGGGTERWVIVDGAVDSTFSGALVNGGAGGLGLSKRGTGTLTISGTSNTYTGATTILNNGVLKVTGALPTATNITIGSAATLGVLQVSTTASNPLGTNTLVFDTTGNASTARLELSGGSTVPNLISLPGRNNTSVAILNTSGNNAVTGTISMIAGGSTYIAQSDAGTLTLGNIQISSGTRTFTLSGAGDGIDNGVLANGGGTLNIIKSGTGTWSLNGTNTYTGTTAINGGTLAVNGSIVSNTTVNTGGALGGTGTISGTVALAGGTLAPGNSPGTLVLSSSLTMDSASGMNYELNGGNTTIGGGINDLTTVASNLTLDGTLNIAETVSGSFLTATAGSTWRLIDYSGTLTDNGLSIGSVPSLASGYSFTIDTATPGQVNLTLIPEPTTLAVLGLGLGSLLRRRRKI